MSSIKRIGDGYYVCVRNRGRLGSIHSPKEIRTQFLVKGTENSHGYLGLGTLSVPKELVGKKIMLRVEIISKIL